MTQVNGPQLCLNFRFVADDKEIWFVFIQSQTIVCNPRIRIFVVTCLMQSNDLLRLSMAELETYCLHGLNASEDQFHYYLDVAKVSAIAFSYM